MKSNDYIYIVLVKALTKLGKFSRKINHYEYTHISVCLNGDLDELIDALITADTAEKLRVSESET